MASFLTFEFVGSVFLEFVHDLIQVCHYLDGSFQLCIESVAEMLFHDFVHGHVEGTVIFMADASLIGQDQVNLLGIVSGMGFFNQAFFDELCDHLGCGAFGHAHMFGEVGDVDAFVIADGLDRVDFRPVELDPGAEI